jgi:RNA polymerase sigma factor (sigma-70 family)
MVLQAGSGSPTQAHEALADLCGRYWYPLYAFARRRGHAHHEAEDCTQGFLAHLLSNAGLERAEPARGRFRTYLLSAFGRYLTDNWRRGQAAKRGGGLVALPFSTGSVEEQYSRAAAPAALTPERAFDRDWASAMIDRAVQELRDDYRRSGRVEVFDALAPLVWGQETSEPLADTAARFRMNPQTLTVALHRLRRRLGERLRSMVAETVADEAEVEAELHHLIRVFSEASGVD